MIITMRFKWHCLLVFVAVSLALVAISAVQSAEDGQHQVAEPQKPAPGVSPRQKFQLPKIFDFELYKNLFKRAYKGLEETVRRKYMLARAFRAWISSIKYKYCKSSYYLAVNNLSDKSPEELKRMANHRLGGRNKAATMETIDLTDEEKDDDDDEQKEHEEQMVPEVDPNEIEESLAKLTSGDEFEGSEELRAELSRVQKSRRRKRDTNNRVRAFDTNKLISNGTNAKLDDETASKVVLRPDSNNPNYEAPELTSLGLRDHFEDISWHDLGLPSKDRRKVADIFRDTTRYLVKGPSKKGDKKQSSKKNKEKKCDPEEEAKLPDEVFFDHRDSKCMFLPRNQQTCGSCYAFTAVAIAEWLYCMQTGKLVPFSEQYIVDCGKAADVTNGCEGSDEFDVGDFIHNYGLELRTNYPYRERETQCPYEDSDVDPRTMGYIRMPLKSAVIVPLKKLEEYIPFGPMFIAINTDNGFQEYGGGVMDGAGCKPNGDHAVTLIGHGREDGREYWLIRNSYGVEWGEQGHYKLAKDADCIHDGKYGILYGTDDAQQHLFRARKNKRYDGSALESHYVNKLRPAVRDVDS